MNLTQQNVSVSEMQVWSEMRSLKVNYSNSHIISDYGLNGLLWSQATIFKEPKEIFVKLTIV